MAGVYSPDQLGIKPPSGGFQEGGWYSGRQYWGGTLSDPGSIHPQSNQVGAGQLVSQEVNAQSAAQQNTTPQQLESYLQQQRQQSASVQPTAQYTPGGMSQQSSSGASEPTTMPSFTPQETPNLPEMYKSLIQESGISNLESQYSDMEKQYIEAKGKINDNPFLSEATRVGRVAKIEQLFNERTANIKGDIATKKADIETQLNLQTKQFDINSQVAQQALSQFNTLLGLGALNNASGEDIAAITRTTGISSNMIQSAIQANKDKDVKTQMVTSTGENGEMFAVLLNSNTGEIINKTSLGVIGNVQGGSGSSTATKAQEEEENTNNLIMSITNNNNLRALVEAFSGALSIDDIYRLYNMYSPFGKARETLAEVKQGKFKT